MEAYSRTYVIFFLSLSFSFFLYFFLVHFNEKMFVLWMRNVVNQCTFNTKNLLNFLYIYVVCVFEAKKLKSIILMASHNQTSTYNFINASQSAYSHYHIKSLCMVLIYFLCLFSLISSPYI